MKEVSSEGGFVVVAHEENEIAGAVIVNKTGMKGYIPENILVYIAVSRAHRGKGVGKQLMKKAIAQAEGDIALHVEPENPAKFLYEKLGFTNKYLEMRLTKDKASTSAQS
jgi:ribosomal protein S18 acetylase RimI-like enzyme